MNPRHLICVEHRGFPHCHILFFIASVVERLEGVMEVVLTEDWLMKAHDNALTNQPETGPIPPPLLLRVVGCCGVVEEAVVDE
eukprot:scaffold172281_cov83-Cyclotella_meneghiniana.AAC.2